MMLFTFLFFVIVVAGILITKKNRAVTPVLFAGILSAVLVCLFRMFFVFAHRVIIYSFWNNFFYIVMNQTLLPVLILCGLFFLISRDPPEYKLDGLFPLTASFYMVYLPFCIVSTSEGLYSAFSLFAKPVMFAAMLLMLSFSARQINKAAAGRKILPVFLFAALALVCLLIPAAIEAMYILTANASVAFVCAAAFCVPLVLLLALRLA